MRTHIKDRVWFIPGRRGGHYPHCNSLFIDSGERAVIDPGSDKKELRSRHEEGVGTVLLSHFHSDHLRDLKEFPGARVLVHPTEREGVESLSGMRRIAFFPEELEDPVWTRRKEREVGGWGWPVAEVFEDGAELMIGDVRVVVVHTPGHTIGHCCFWLPDQKILFAADVDLTDFGPWYGNACSDLASFQRSIQRLKLLQPEITVTGHELGVVEGDIAGRLEAYGRIIGKRHAAILAFLDRPRAFDDIVNQAFIYGTYFAPGNSFFPSEQRMIRHHLALAVAEGQVMMEDGHYLRTGVK